MLRSTKKITEKELQQLELSMKRAEEAHRKIGGKRREERWLITHPSFKKIPVVLLPKIFSYLDSVKEVWQLSIMCKPFRDAISPKLVVRAAVFQGGKSQYV